MPFEVQAMVWFEPIHQLLSPPFGDTTVMLGGDTMEKLDAEESKIAGLSELVT
jgi:hypothetical protein